MYVSLSSVLPDVLVGSEEEFSNIRRSNEDMLARCYLTQQGMASAAEDVRCDGSCAICLRTTTYTSPTAHGELVGETARVPKWRDHQRCSCELALSFCERAVIHTWLRLQTKTMPRALVLGHTNRIGKWLQGQGYEVSEVFGRDLSERVKLIEKGAYDAVFCIEYLDQVPNAAGLLLAMREALAPGGVLLVTTALHYASTSSALNGEVDLTQMRAMDHQVHHFGWDLVGLIKSAGFAEAGAVIPWSKELGYLGLFNFVFIGAVTPGTVTFSAQETSDE